MLRCKSILVLSGVSLLYLAAALCITKLATESRDLVSRAPVSTPVPFPGHVPPKVERISLSVPGIIYQDGNVDTKNWATYYNRSRKISFKFPGAQDPALEANRGFRDDAERNEIFGKCLDGGNPKNCINILIITRGEGEPLKNWIQNHVFLNPENVKGARLILINEGQVLQYDAVGKVSIRHRSGGFLQENKRSFVFKKKNTFVVAWYPLPNESNKAYSDIFFAIVKTITWLE